MNKVKAAWLGAGLGVAGLLAGCGGDGEGFLEGPERTDFRVGVLEGSTLADGQVQFDLTTIPSGGRTLFRLDLVDRNGRLATDPVVATFFSPCLANGLASVTVTPASESLLGRLTAEYVAAGCTGEDVVTVSIMPPDTPSLRLTATGVITIAASALGALEYLPLPTPLVLGLVGTSLPTQGRVFFQVRDADGQPLANRRVTFDVLPVVAGNSLSTREALSDRDGVVSTVISAGSLATPVRVVATTVDPQTNRSFQAQSEQVSLSTGIPDQDSVSLSASRLSIDGTCDGESTDINIRLADRFNNPVPDGTAVSFISSGGLVRPQCFTEDSVCTVELRVQNPRPANGRVVVLATALGEESFVDRNGNGFFDGNDLLTTDLAEPFLDANENGVRDPDERIIDTNGDGQFSPPNQRFDGYRCDAPGINCRIDLVHVRSQIPIVFSNARNQLAFDCGPGGCPRQFAALFPGELIDVVVTVVDGNGQPPPSGTTFTLVASDGEIVSAATLGPFNTSAPGPIGVGYTFRPPEQAEMPVVIDLTLQVQLPDSACSGPVTIAGSVARVFVPAKPVDED